MRNEPLTLDENLWLVIISFELNAVLWSNTYMTRADNWEGAIDYAKGIELVPEARITKYRAVRYSYVHEVLANG